MKEKTDLEMLVIKVSEGVTNISSVLLTPKFHCKLAVEGIEYSWGTSKRICCCYHLTKKCSSAMFESLVRSSIYNVNKRMDQHFSAKARGYMLTYLHKLVKKKEQDENIKNANDTKPVIWTYQYNKKIHKTYHGYRYMNCIDGKFIEIVMFMSIDRN